jgi:DNA-binding CsgD family transcriptional regulator/tetratricopeptide (TPR) repeat protein
MTHADHLIEPARSTSQWQRDQLTIDRSSDLVGREAELGELLGILDQLTHEHSAPRLAEVTGDAGIGKTALLSEFAKAAQARGTVVLASWGLCSRRNVPYSAFTDAFDDHQRPSPTDLGDAAKVREVLEGIAVLPLVLILDELHTADPNSLDLLASLLHHPPKAPVLFVLGYRDRQVNTRLRSAVNGWSPQVAVTHLHLGPMSEQEVEEILAGQSIATWRRTLYEESWGNPAYLKALISERIIALVRPGGARGLARAARSDHYAAFLSELIGVAPEVRTVANAAAVIGCEFDADLVAGTLDWPEAVTLQALGVLISRDLIHPVARGPYFAFRHPVVHRAVYKGCELSTRMDFHIRADRILRSRGASATERAPHVEQWAKHGDLNAVDVLDEAARAISGTEPVTAASWLTTALRVLPKQAQFAERRARLLVRLAKARGAAGNLRECRDIMHQALRFLPREPADQHAKAVAFTGMVQRLLGGHAETDALLRAELAALGDEHLGGRAALVFEIAARELSGGDWAACCRWAEEGLQLAQRSQNKSRQMACHGLMAKANLRAGNRDAAARHHAEATAILDRMLDGDFAYSLDAVVWIGWTDSLLECWDDALRHFDKAVEFATRAGRLLALPHLLVGQVFALYNRGLLREAQAAAEYAVYLAHQSGSPDQLASAHSMLAWTDTIMGRFDRAVESGNVAAGHLNATVVGFAAIAARMLAEARLMSGDVEGCIALVNSSGAVNVPTADACFRLAWYELLTRAELALGRPEAAAGWADSAMAAAKILDQPGSRGLALLARAQALLAVEPEAALCAAEQAVRGLTSAGMRVDALRARVTFGLALWHHGSYDDAARELKDAQLGLEQLGATTLVRYARKERRRLAARTSKVSGVGVGADGTVAGLTDRERQIASLVSQGLTNRLIAKSLHISEKTVEMHLSKVFAKLGVSNRAAVAAFVTRDGPEGDEGAANLVGGELS